MICANPIHTKHRKYTHKYVYLIKQARYERVTTNKQNAHLTFAH